MKKIKITADSFTAELLRKFFAEITFATAMLSGYELEHLVLLEWHRKNYMKTQFEKEYRISMMPHEAISLYRIIFRFGFTDHMAAITRDQLCEQISRQLPSNPSRIQKHNGQCTTN